MRQETTNTFDGGLNKDLNPVITPNDILTDCLNGTFVTFNGDELTLQNDAGNTRVPIPWDSHLSTDYVNGESYSKGVIVRVLENKEIVYYESKVENNDLPLSNEEAWEVFTPYVTLSDGFYPIGMKEYGGVLYIVSGKKGLYEPDGTYSLDGYNNPIRPDLIEFGSYPSPEYMSTNESKGQHLITLIDPKSQCYKFEIISNDLFKTGGYVRFGNFFSGNDFADTENLLWTPNHEGLYKIKLLHILDNGIYDLTDDIWKDYILYQREETLNNVRKENKISVPDHWINSTHFKFYCPTRYKGKLALKAELNEPKYFEFENQPRVSFENSMTQIEFNILWDTESPIEITDYDVKLMVVNKDGSLENCEYDVIENSSSNIKIVEIDQKLTEVVYEITPITQYAWSELPEEFTEKFTLKGDLNLGFEYLGYNFELREGKCLEDRYGWREYKLAAFRADDKYLGPDLKELPTGTLTNISAFLNVDEYTNNKMYYKTYNILGTFEVVNDTMKIVEVFEDSLLNEDALDILEHFKHSAMFAKVIVEDASCHKRYVRITFQENFKSGTFLKFTWRGTGGYSESYTIQPGAYTSEDGSKYNVYVIDYKENADLDINVGSQTYLVRRAEIKPHTNDTDGEITVLKKPKSGLNIVFPNGTGSENPFSNTLRYDRDFNTKIGIAQKRGTLNDYFVGFTQASANSSSAILKIAYYAKSDLGILIDTIETPSVTNINFWGWRVSGSPQIDIDPENKLVTIKLHFRYSDTDGTGSPSYPRGPEDQNTLPEDELVGGTILSGNFKVTQSALVSGSRASTSFEVSVMSSQYNK